MGRTMLFRCDNVPGPRRSALHESFQGGRHRDCGAEAQEGPHSRAAWEGEGSGTSYRAKCCHRSILESRLASLKRQYHDTRLLWGSMKQNK